jgi:hypothetical protein
MVRFSHHDMDFRWFLPHRTALCIATYHNENLCHADGRKHLTVRNVIAKHLTLHCKTTKSHVMLTGGGISPYGIVLRGFTWRYQ